MKSIHARGLATPSLLAVPLVAATVGELAAQPDRMYERINDNLGPAGGLGMMLAALFAVSALVGIVIMLLFALREINRTRPHAR